MDGHSHNFDDWPFVEAQNSKAYTTRFVLDNNYPILMVSHDADDGSWQFLCGTSSDPRDGRIACLGCLFEADPGIGDLASLPRGWIATRESTSHEWIKTAFESDDFDDD